MVCFLCGDGDVCVCVRIRLCVRVLISFVENAVDGMVWYFDCFFRFLDLIFCHPSVIEMCYCTL